jgi:hypothetical protein
MMDGASGDLSDGQIDEQALRSPVQTCRKKYFISPIGRNSFIDSSSRPDQRGRFAIVTDVGAGCDGRKALQRQHWRGRTAHLRTAKPCGPDAPTLASSFAE